MAPSTGSNTATTATSPSRTTRTTSPSSYTSASATATATTSTTTANSLLSSTVPLSSHHHAEPTMTDLLLSTPPPVLKFLALAAPVIHALAYFSQLVTWHHGKFFESALVLLSWWAICLFGQFVLRWALPGAVILWVFASYLLGAAQRPAAGAKSSSSSSSSRRAAHRHYSDNSAGGSSFAGSSSSSLPTTLTPASYAALLTSATILATALQSLRASLVRPALAHLSFVPPRPSTRHSPAYNTATRALSLWPAYIILTTLVPLRLIALGLGSVALLWHAPFFESLRHALWASAAVRWTVRVSVAVLQGRVGDFKKEWKLTGQGQVGVPGLIGSWIRGSDKARGAAGGQAIGSSAVSVVDQKKMVSSSSSAAPSSALADGGKRSITAATGTGVAEDLAKSNVGGAAGLAGSTAAPSGVQATFTVFENQRWWVGLDWTHALLPGERASWTDPALHPANPPSSFVLPPASTTTVPHPTRLDPLARMRKTSEWRWIDREWRVMRGQPGETSVTSATTGLDPRSEKEKTEPGWTPAVSATANHQADAHTDDAKKARRAAAGTGGGDDDDDDEVDGQDASAGLSLPQAAVGDDEGFFANWQVDAEGWQYGDNHFDKMGPRGGLGKYTRRRAWVRRAHLVERTEIVPGPGHATGAGQGGGSIGGTSSSGGDGSGNGAGLSTGAVGLGSGHSASPRKDRSATVSRDRERRKREASGGGTSPGTTDLTRSTSGSGSLRRRKSSSAGSGGTRKKSGAEVGEQG